MKLGGRRLGGACITTQNTPETRGNRQKQTFDTLPLCRAKLALHRQKPFSRCKKPQREGVLKAKN
jgi:hypothetical protein